MMRFFLKIVFYMGLFAACSPPQSKEEGAVLETQRKTCNAIYFWKTNFKLSNQEYDFLLNHKIGRMYIRYFDIVADQEDHLLPVPEVTLRFHDSIPEGLEVVPTVFIENQLFKLGNMDEIPVKLVNRILTMSATHDVTPVKEIQIDCDWTQTTEKVYFKFLDRVRSLLSERNILLSVTIRLHQLRMKVPSVDRGVLMCYNTGAIRSNETRNSILDADDVNLYAKNLRTYRLPLDIAYPVFSWAVWFQNNTFQSLLRGLDPSSPHIMKKGKNRFAVIKGFYQEGHYLAKGDEVRFETSPFNEVIRSKRLLEPALKHYSVILYHLDTSNLSNYTSHEIDEIYNH